MNASRNASGARPPRRHHTVPKVLLKSFANEKGRIWTRLIDQDRVVQLSLDDASVRTGFNTKEDGSWDLERFFANEVESPFGRLVDEGYLSVPGVISKLSVKRTVCRFFLSQFLRVSGAREAYQERANDFIDENLPQHHAQLKKAAKRFGQRYGRPQQRETEERMRELATSADTHIEFTQAMIQKHLQELERLQWRLIQIPFGGELILSDAPAKAMRIEPNGSLTVLDFQGVARLDVLLFLALTPSLALLAQMPPRASTFPSAVFNQVTAMAATQLYARSQDAFAALV
jgi:hypothetical protein